MKWKPVHSIGLVMVVLVALSVGYFLLRSPGTAPSTRAPLQASADTRMQAGSNGQQAPPAIEIATDKQALIGLKTSPVALVSLHKTIRTTGRADYDETRVFTVNTKVEGWIERLYVDYTGRHVRKGEPLIEIYSPDLLAAQQELIDLMSWGRAAGDGAATGMLAEDSSKLKAAARRRLKLLDITEGQIRRIEQTGAVQRTMTILSPASGYVIRKDALKGMRVMAGERLLDIADLGTVWVVAEVSEPDIGSVRTGQPARITFAGLPGKVFFSKIAYINPVLDEETRTTRVRFTLLNRSGELKPQMYATIEFAVDLGRRLAVPEDAVLDTGERQIAYVDKGEGNFEPREVQAGVRANGYREVLRGLEPGERVATTPVFLIDSEAQLKGVTPLLLDTGKPVQP